MNMPRYSSTVYKIMFLEVSSFPASDFFQKNIFQMSFYLQVSKKNSPKKSTLFSRKKKKKKILCIYVYLLTDKPQI